MLTRCPHCNESFMVNAEQLQAARGKVRCGNCMQIFNAAIHLETSPQGKSAAQEAADDESPYVRALEKTRADESSSRTAEFSAGGNAPDSSRTVWSEETQSERDGKDATYAGGFSALDGELVFQDDPEADASGSAYKGGMLPDSELSDSFLELEREGEPSFREAEVESTPADESWAEAMLQDLDKEERREPGFGGNRPAATRASSAGMPPAPSPRSQPALDAGIPAPAVDRPAPLRAEPRTPVPNSESWGVQPERPNLRRSHPVVRAAFAVSALVLLLLLLAQLGYYHYDKLGQIPWLRPIYIDACARLGCTLPDISNVRKIESESLQVRSHPLVPNALIIDIELRNRAPWSQPFPAIQISFADANNRLIARRTVAPHEYLREREDLPKALASESPVHISLELVDPGDEAVNYTIDFLPDRSSAAE